jgi:hypothetical protein
MVMFRLQNAGQNHNIKIGNKLFKCVALFKYLETALTNYMNEEVKSRLSSANSCCHTVQNFCLPVCYLET